MMKTSILMFLLLSAFVGKGQSLDDSLVANYCFDDSTANDYSKNQFNGSILGAPSKITGVYGNGFLFDGKADYIQVPDNSLLNLDTVASNWQFHYGIKTM